MVQLSIVIPVYKVEKYIHKCLNSIFSNKVDTSVFEVIIVNDGTPDRSMEIVSDFSHKFPNIRVINQVNQGLSIARNNGIVQAIGRYVWCVDSDDWISENSIDIIIRKSQEVNADIFAIGIMNVQESSGEQRYLPFNKVTLNRRKNKGKDFLFDNNRLTPTQKYVYKSSFLREHHLEYYPGILHEDAEYCLRALYLAQDIYIIDSACYYYLHREAGAITKSYSKRNFDDLLIVYNELTKFEKFINYEDLRFWRAEKVITVLMFMLGAMAITEREISNKTSFWRNFNSSYRHLITKELWRGLFTRKFNYHSLVMCVLYYISPKFLFKHIQKKKR